MEQVFEEVYDARVKWRNIGLKLGVDNNTLKAILDEQNHNVDNCFLETLNKWLTGNKERTWSRLADVMESKIVSYPDIASNIRSQYCQ